MQRPTAASKAGALGSAAGGQAATAAPTPPGPPRPPGLLALFPATVARYPRDGSVAWRVRPGRVHRDRRHEPQPPPPAVPPEAVPFRSVVARADVVLVLFLDPHQPHSLRVRNALVELCAAHDLVCIVVSAAAPEPDGDGADEEAAGPSPRPDALAVCLRGTGFCHAPVTAVLQTALCVSQVPALVVLHRGRRVSGAQEELALEWGDPEEAVAAWRRGASALTAGQRIRAALAFPLCAVL